MRNRWPFLVVLGSVIAAMTLLILGAASVAIATTVVRPASESTAYAYDAVLTPTTALTNVAVAVSAVSQPRSGGARAMAGVSTTVVAAEEGAGANVPVGRSGNPIDIEPGTNEPGEVNGRQYSGHAFDRMQGRGIPPSAVDEAIQNPESVTPGRGGTTIYKSPDGVTVVVGSGGRVVTVW